MQIRRMLVASLAMIAGLANVERAMGQTFPARPVRIVVGFPPGGVGDIVARLVGQWLSERLGQPFVIENRPGAASNIATEAVVRAPADGYTLLVVNPANATSATLYDRLNFNFIRDIAPVAGLVRVPNVMEVSPSVPARTVPEFIAYAKANPGKVNYASAGNGTTVHLAGELFRIMTGVNMVHVPYRGSAPALTDMLSGQMQVMFDTLPSSIEHLRAGKLRALAVTTSTRFPALPDIPTMGDYVPGFEASVWQGIGVPKNTPPAIVGKLNKEINAALADPRVKEQLANLGSTVLALSPAEFGRLITEETEKWAAVIRAANIKAEGACIGYSGCPMARVIGCDPGAVLSGVKQAMHRAIETQVLIAGAGPVGLTLAMDLAWRGIDVTVAELRRTGELPSVKCNSISARSMEIFRRLGLARKLRGAGLPADYPNDVASRTTATGIELSRLAIPSRSERYSATEGPDTSWPTPEPPHRINQVYFEPILFAHAAAQPRIRILNRTALDDFTQDDCGVIAFVRDVENSERTPVACAFLIGCDGGKSIVRKRIGARFVGVPVVQRVQSTYIRAPGLVDLLPGKPAWMYFSLNPRRCGTTIAIDGRETWLIHNFLYRDEAEFDSVDRDWAIRTILGLGPDFKYDVIAKEDWIGRRLVADRFRDRRVFICGDAAHLWIPHAGYGMNAGIADAANLSWLIAATLHGWAPLTILSAYEAERQPIADEVSRFTTEIASKIMKQRREISAEIEEPGPVGDAVRARLGKEAYELDLQQQCCGGLNFGYFYARSPIIAYDGEPQPAYTMHDFTPSTVPGCRAPHLWLKEERSLYDALGPDYTLLRTDPAARVSGIIEAAARRDVPLVFIEGETPDAHALYRRKLTLIRPDQHVAWRGDEEPSSPLDLIDLVRGAGRY